MSELDDVQRRALCRLYRALAELKGVDASNPSEAAELKARAAMEGVGLVVDLPPAGGIPWSSSSSSSSSSSLSVEESATLALANAAESAIDATFGAESPGDEGDKTDDDGEEKEKEEEVAATTLGPLPRAPPSPRPPLTYVMLLRGLFDTQQEEALALMGGGGGDLLKGMAVRRLPQAMAPVLRMVANLRGVCAHLVRRERLTASRENGCCLLLLAVFGACSCSCTLSLSVVRNASCVLRGEKCMIFGLVN